MKGGHLLTTMVFLLLAALLPLSQAQAAPGDFRFQWGGQHAFHSPLGVALDSGGNLYVADTLHYKIQKFDGSGTLLTQWGGLGSGAGQFTSPVALAVDASGSVFVVDSNNNRIQKFDASGRYLSQWGSFGSGDGQFRYPYGIALDAAGNLFVADTSNHRIQKFSNSGAFLAKWGGTAPGSGNGQFCYPNAVALDPSGNLYVADTFNSRIQKFSSNGTYLLQWGSAGSAPGMLQFPEGVTLDAKGNVYVADTENNRVVVCTGSGAVITSWGQFGFRHGELNYPYGVALDASGNVYLADTANQRIQKFSSSGTYLREFGGAATGQFDFPLGAALDDGAKVYLADQGNNRLKKFDQSGYDLSQRGHIGSGNGQLWYPNAVALGSSSERSVVDSNSDRVQNSDGPGTYQAQLEKPGMTNGPSVPPGTWDFGANLFISDTGNGGVQKSSSDGSYLAMLGGDPGLGPPGGAADADRVSLANPGNSRILKLSSARGFLTLWGSLAGDFAPFDASYGVAADGVGNLYLLDSFNSRVQVFDRAGNLKGQWGSFGTGKGQFFFPCGIATNAAGTIVYVADGENDRIQAFDGFGLGRFDLRYSAGANGTLSGTASQSVYSGGTGTQVTAVANPGYHFVSWSDGVATAARTDTAVPASLSVTASFTFTEVNHTLRFTAGAGGTLRGVPRQTVRSGGSSSAVGAVPNTGHHFVKWSGDRGFDTTTVNPLTVRNVKTNQVVIAYFAAKQYQVTFVAGAHGELTGKTLQSVSHAGSTTSVAAVPARGFHFVNWTDASNHVVSYSATLQFTNVTASKRLTANFK